MLFSDDNDEADAASVRTLKRKKMSWKEMGIVDSFFVSGLFWSHKPAN